MSYMCVRYVLLSYAFCTSPPLFGLPGGGGDHHVPDDLPYLRILLMGGETDSTVFCLCLCIVHSHPHLQFHEASCR